MSDCSGEFQSPAVYALAQAMNGALGNVGQTVTYIDPVEVDAVEHGQSIKELIAEMNAGQSRYAGDHRRQSRI